MDSSLHQAPPSRDFLGKSTGVGCHFLLQQIFLTQGLNPGLPHCRQMLYHLSHKGLSNANESTSDFNSQNVIQKTLTISVSFLLALVAQTVKRLFTMQETWVQSLGQEDLLEKEMAIHSSTIAWKIPWTEEPGGLQSLRSQRVGHD